jgi:GH24 family phage-related lysozyme (muramidase)
MPRLHSLAATFAIVAAVMAITGCATRARSPDDYPTDTDAQTPGIFNDLGGKAVLPAGKTLRPVIPSGLAVTKKGEGWRKKLYNDVAGFCTIGYGHLIKRARCDGSEPADWLDGITEPEGEALLVADMKDAQIVVMLAVNASITDTQYGALCDFVFNVGGSAFRKSTLLKVVNAGQHDQVANQLMRWTVAGGKQVPGLLNRRKQEIELYYQGTLGTRAVPPAGMDMSPIDVTKGEP